MLRLQVAYVHPPLRVWSIGQAYEPYRVSESVESCASYIASREDLSLEATWQTAFLPVFTKSHNFEIPVNSKA